MYRAIMEWRDIPEFEGYYPASPDGDIRRIGNGRVVVSGRIRKTQKINSRLSRYGVSWEAILKIIKRLA